MSPRCRICGGRSVPRFRSCKDRCWTFADMCSRYMIAYERGRSEELSAQYTKNMMDKIERLEKTNKALQEIIDRFIQDEKVGE